MTTQSAVHGPEGQNWQGGFVPVPGGEQQYRYTGGRISKPIPARLGLAAKLVFGRLGCDVATLNKDRECKERFERDVITLYGILSEMHDKIAMGAGGRE